MFDTDSVATMLPLDVEPEEKAYGTKICGALEKDVAEAEQARISGH